MSAIWTYIFYLSRSGRSSVWRYYQLYIPLWEYFRDDQTLWSDDQRLSTYNIRYYKFFHPSNLCRSWRRLWMRRWCLFPTICTRKHRSVLYIIRWYHLCSFWCNRTPGSSRDAWIYRRCSMSRSIFLRQYVFTCRANKSQWLFHSPIWFWWYSSAQLSWTSYRRIWLWCRMSTSRWAILLSTYRICRHRE